MEKTKFNFKELKKNIVFIVPALIIIILALAFSFIMGNSGYRIDEEDLPVDGNNIANKLIISEIMTNNGGVVIDKEGNLYDWIELYNGKDHAVNLLNYALSDNADEVKWVFPNVTIESHSYLIVYLSGKTKEGLYTNFKLKSAGGEDIILRNSDGKVIDMATTSSLRKDEVMFRNLSGEWKTNMDATPGFSNTEKGLTDYYSSLTALNDDLKINELLARNKGNFKTLEGEYSGYIELINTSKNDIDLSNYSLSNDIHHPFMWQLPKKILKPNEIIVVYTSGLNIINDKEIHTSFTLDKEKGEAILSKNDKIVGRVNYSNLANGMALVNENNAYKETSSISPGYPNTTDGVKAFSEQYLVNPGSLIINEVMSSNYSYLPQNGGKYYDWIELKNNTSSDIKLNEYYLTTNSDDPTKWRLPNITLKPGEYYVVMASGDTKLSNNSYYHTNFNLGDTQALFLYKADDIVDSLFIANTPVGYSLGRSDKNGFYYFKTPTPKASNGSGLQTIAYIPVSTTKSGVYDNVTEVSVKLEAPGTIYYTLDGSNPTASSKIYNGPILLTKTTVVKAISIENNKINSKVLTSSYIINEKHTLPVLSISLKPGDFSSVVQSVNAVDYEVAANAELYEKGKSFSIPCGLKLFGGSTRFIAKKSFSINFRKEYGASTLNYQVFDNRDFSSFNSLVVRSGSQDYDNAFFRDILMTSIVDKYTDVDTQAYKTVVLYVNGEYWGVYDLREKVDAEFISNHYNVSEDGTNILRIDSDVKAGTAQNYYDLLNYIRNHNLSNQTNYNYVKEKIDIDNIVDYWIAELWPANWDTLNVRYFQNPNIDNNKWKFIYYDLDTGMHNIEHNYYLYMTNPEGMSSFGHSTELLRNLMKSSEFKKTFLEHLSYQLTHVWTTDNVLKRIDEIYNSIYKEMPRDKERWNLSMSNWEKEVEDLKDFARKRPKYLLATTKSFFNLSNSDMEKYFGDVDA